VTEEPVSRVPNFSWSRAWGSSCECLDLLPGSWRTLTQCVARYCTVAMPNSERVSTDASSAAVEVTADYWS
jgi:hypothetical protein